MPPVGESGAVSLVAMDTVLQATESAAAAQVAVLDQVLQAQAEMLATVLQSLGVGNLLDVTA